MKIPIQPPWPGSLTVLPALGLPPIPRALLDEADHLFAVRLTRPGPLLEQMTVAYAFLDKVNREFVSTFVTCTKGCSHCCRIDVGITTFEAQYIAAATGIRRATPPATLTTGNEGPCPFLSSAGECSIYACRPLFCRTYHSLSDPKLCAIPGAFVRQYGFIGMGNRFYERATEWIHLLNQHMSGDIRDIRDFFPHDPATIHAHLATNPPRLPA